MGHQRYDCRHCHVRGPEPGPSWKRPRKYNSRGFVVGILGQFPLWYFSANDGTHGREFFVAYEGNAPADLYDINAGPANSDPGAFDSVAGETGLLVASTASSGRELLEVQQPPLPPLVNGPRRGTATEVTGVGPGMGSNPVLAPTSQIGLTPQPEPVTRTYFAGDLAGHGRQFWPADEVVSLSPGEGVRPASALGASGWSM